MASCLLFDYLESSPTTLTLSGRGLLAKWNLTGGAYPSDTTSDSNATTYHGFNNLGNLVPRVSPTPPRGLSLSIKVVVEKLISIDRPAIKRIINDRYHKTLVVDDGRRKYHRAPVPSAPPAMTVG